jgi:hypothetical protein
MRTEDRRIHIGGDDSSRPPTLWAVSTPQSWAASLEQKAGKFRRTKTWAASRPRRTAQVLVVMKEEQVKIIPSAKNRDAPAVEGQTDKGQKV